MKAKYDLWVTSAEQAAIRRVLAPCDGQALTPDPWGAPTEVDQNMSDPTGCPRMLRPETATQCTTRSVTRRVRPARPRSAPGTRVAAHT